LLPLLLLLLLLLSYSARLLGGLAHTQRGQERPPALLLSGARSTNVPCAHSCQPPQPLLTMTVMLTDVDNDNDDVTRV
jgi:hypothetical protein